MSQGPAGILELRSVRGTGGGPEKTILQGAARTDRSRFAVTVCYLRDPRDRAFSIGSEAERLALEYVEINDRHALDWRVFHQLRELVRSRRIQVVHAHEYKTDLLALLLARSEGVAPLATVHGWTGNTFRERYVYYPGDKRALRRFPKVIAVSNDIRQELVANGVDDRRIHVILNGIDEAVFARVPGLRSQARRELGYGSEHVLIGSVGRLERQKRFDLLIEAFASLVRTRPNVRLAIAGDGTLRRELENCAVERGVASFCSFLGHRTDVVALNHAFDVFVQSSEYEGTPNAVLEAMACETPVVATDVGGTAELARPVVDGLVVAPHNVEALADAIRRCLDDRTGARARVLAARARVVSELSFAARMAKVETIYEELAMSQTGAVSAGAQAASRLFPKSG